MLDDRDALRALIESKRALVTIVEGKRDVAALHALGFTHVEELDAPLYAVVERHEKGSVVQILTDLDAEGRSLFAKLRADFAQRGVRIDNELREALFCTPLRHIEGLDTYLRT